MKQNEWITIIIVMIIISAIVAYVTGAITGNIIKVSTSKSGTAVYTQAEVDNQILKNVNQGLFTYLSTAKVVNGGTGIGVAGAPKEATVYNDCNTACKSDSQTQHCILGLHTVKGQSNNVISTSEVVACNQKAQITLIASVGGNNPTTQVYQLQCICGSPLTTVAV